MKKSILSFFALFTFAITFAQTTITIQPNAVLGKDVNLLTTQVDDAADQTGSSGTTFGADAWTCQGSPCFTVGLLQFDLTAIPQGATVSSAFLSLYANPNSNIGQANNPTYGNDNAAYLKQNTAAWDENTVTWNTKPTTTSTDQVLLPQSTSTTQDYTNIDITSWAQLWVNNPAQNFGFDIELITTSYYNCMNFCSSDYSDSTKHPKLVITYTIPNSTCYTFQPDSTEGKDVNLLTTQVDDAADQTGSSGTTFGADAWTCQGSPCFTVGLLQFDLTAIPQGATVSSAFLSLYANPNSNIGQANNPTYGNDNAAYLKQNTAAWDENTVTWNTKPTTTSTDQVLLPQSTSTTQDYTNIDITSWAQLWVNNPAQNFGFDIELITTSYYNCMNFCSSDYPDATKRPKLSVCVASPSAVNDLKTNELFFTIYPIPSNDLLTIETNESLVTTVEIFDISGRSLLSFTIINKKNISVRDLPSGVYVVKLTGANGTGTKMWIKN